MPSILLIIIAAFCVIAFFFLAAFFWAKWYPTTLCSVALRDDREYNVCIKRKNHLDLHMTADGREF